LGGLAEAHLIAKESTALFVPGGHPPNTIILVGLDEASDERHVVFLSEEILLPRYLNNF
jgi:hypothetical protein